MSNSVPRSILPLLLTAALISACSGSSGDSGAAGNSGGPGDSGGSGGSVAIATAFVERIPGSLNHSPDATWWGYNMSKIVRR